MYQARERIEHKFMGFTMISIKLHQWLGNTFTGPAKTEHVGAKYILLHNGSCLSNKVYKNLYPVTWNII